MPAVDNQDLTQAELRALLAYDAETGVFRWRKRLGGKRPAGAMAGCKTRSGYILIGIRCRLFKAHRLAWLYVYGCWPMTPHLDHINGDPSDNRIANLREATPSQNGGNSRRSKNNRTGLKGVYFDQRYGTWSAKIKVNRRSIHLGTFHSPEKAHEAYRRASVERFGPFARHG